MHFSSNVEDFKYQKAFLFSQLPSIGSGQHLLRISHETWGGKRFLVRANLDTQIIAYVIKGSGKFRVDDAVLDLGAGMVFGVGADHYHELYTAGKDMEIIIIGGSLTLKELFLEILGESTFAYELRNSLEIQHLFEAILNEIEFSNPYSHDICLRYYDIILRKIALNRMSERRQDDKALLTFNKCRQFTDRNFETLRSSGEIAEKCNLATAYLCRLFKRYEKISPGNYLVRLKMNQASDLLISTHMSIKNIAKRLNFDSPYTFSRTFKKHMGLPPLHFRRKHGYD